MNININYLAFKNKCTINALFEFAVNLVIIIINFIKNKNLFIYLFIHTNSS